MQKPIYLDYHATTPADPAVIEAMQEYFYNHFGNTMSSTHQWGWSAEKAVSKARQQIANLIQCRPQEIYFTSGATESNNWVLRGLVDQIRSEDPQAKIHIITGAAEHSSILNSFKALAQIMNFELDIAPTNSYGQIDPTTITKLIRPHTRLISITWVQNEIGSVNDVIAIGNIARQNKIYFHTDATQAIGKIPVNLESMPIDLLSCSAHKFYGPKGVGLLYQRSRNPKVSIKPLFYGGGHERGERSGTLNTPGIVGMGRACEILSACMEQEVRKYLKHRDLLITELLKIPNTKLNGHPTERSPVNVNISFLGQKIESHIGKLAGLGFSAGAACMSGLWSATPVLKSIGVSDLQAQGTIRLSVGRWTEDQEIHDAIALLQSTFGQSVPNVIAEPSQTP